MFLRKVCIQVVVLATIFSVANAVGRVPEGVFNSEQFNFDNLDDVTNDCDTTVSCAGITYHPHEQIPNEWAVYFHSFIPPLLNNTKEHDWVTQRSRRAVVTSLCFIPANSSATTF